MADQKLKIIISALAGQATSEINKLNKELDETGAAVQKVNPLMGMMKGSVIALGTAYLTQVPALVQQGEAINRAKLALEGYTGSAAAAEEATNAVKAAAGGAISEFVATQQAAQLFAMGLADSADEAAKLTEMAVTLGASMGKGPQQAFEEFTLLLANQSIPRLDTFGISGAKVRDRIQELQAETKGLSREQAFLTAVMEDGSIKLDQLSEAGFEATSSIDILKVRVQETTQAHAEWLADGLLPILDGLLAIEAATEDHNATLAISSISYQDYTDTMIATRQNMDMLTEAEYNAARGLERMNPELRLTGQAVEETGIKVQQLSTRWEEYANAGVQANQAVAAATEAVTVSLIGLTEAEVGRTLLGDINREYEEGSISADDYSQSMNFILGDMLNMDPASVAATIGIANLRQELDNGTASAWETVGAADALIERLTRLQDFGDMNFSFNFSDVPSGGGQTSGGGGSGSGTTGTTPVQVYVPGTTGEFQ